MIRKKVFDKILAAQYASGAARKAVLSKKVGRGGVRSTRFLMKAIDVSKETHYNQ